MENLTRRKRSKKPQLTIICKKHPKHHQSPGVCSICLREKLSKLPSTSSSRATTITNASTSSSLSSLSSLSSQCSSNASSLNSPMHDHNRGKLGLKGKGYMLSFLKSNKIVLTKSRSMTTYIEEKESVDHHGIIKSKKKGGFWSKLIRSNSTKKMMGEATQASSLMHSRTMRDMLTTRI